MRQLPLFSIPSVARCSSAGCKREATTQLSYEGFSTPADFCDHCCKTAAMSNHRWLTLPGKCCVLTCNRDATDWSLSGFAHCAEDAAIIYAQGGK